MQCYFLFSGRIHAVEALDNVSSDDDAVERAIKIFRTRIYQEKQSIDGFEVWDKRRFVYRFPNSQDRPKAQPGAGE